MSYCSFIIFVNIFFASINQFDIFRDKDLRLIVLKKVIIHETKL